MAVTRDDLARLSRFRLEKNWTFKQLADAIGIHESSMFRILQARRTGPLRATTAFKIDQFLTKAGVR